MNRTPAPQSRWPGSTGAALALLASGLLASITRAQDDYDVPDDYTGQNQAMVPQMVLVDNNNVAMFDQWVFNQVGGAGHARQRLNSMLALKLDEIERSCSLSAAQQKKLELAGKGDIKRFFDEIEQAKRKWQSMKDRNNNNIWNDVLPFQTRLSSSIFDDSSLLSKSLNTMLSTEQLEKLKTFEQRRLAEHHHALVSLFVVNLDKAMGFSLDQNRRLREILESRTRPPRRFWQSDYYYLIYEVSRIDEQDLKPIFTELQWKALSQLIQQGKGMAHWLKQQGVIPDDDPPDAAKQAELDRLRVREKKAQIAADEAERKKAEAKRRERDHKVEGQERPLDAIRRAGAHDEAKKDAATREVKP